MRNFLKNPFDRSIKQALACVRLEDGRIDEDKHIFYMQPLYSRQLHREFGQDTILLIRQEVLAALLASGIQFITIIKKDGIYESLTSMWAEEPTVVFMDEEENFIGMHINRFKSNNPQKYKEYIQHLPRMSAAEEASFIYVEPRLLRGGGTL